MSANIKSEAEAVEIISIFDRTAFKTNQLGILQWGSSSLAVRKEPRWGKNQKNFQRNNVGPACDPRHHPLSQGAKQAAGPRD